MVDVESHADDRPSTSGGIHSLRRRLAGSSVLLAALALSAPAVHADPAGAKETYNVREFGARGDGVTDDTLSIQAAIDDAVKADGGIVYVPAGTYKVSTPPGTSCADQPYCAALHVYGSDVSVVGEGRAASTLTNGSETNILLRVGGLETEPIRGSISGVTISKLRFTNAGAPQTLAAGASLVHLDTRRGTVENALIDDIFIDGSGITGVTIHGSHNTLRRSWIRNTAEHGVYMAGDHTTKKLTTDQTVVENVIEYPAAHELSQSMHSFADAIKVTRTHHGLIAKNTIRLGNGPSEGINVEASSHSMYITGNKLALGGANQIGIRISTRAVRVSGGSVDGGGGYTNTLGVDARSESRSSIVQDVRFTGVWQAAVLIQRSGASDVVFQEVSLASAPKGSWAIDLTSAVRPRVERSEILDGDRGISLGTSDGAQVIRNRILSKYKYDLTGPPTNYRIEE